MRKIVKGISALIVIIIFGVSIATVALAYTTDISPEPATRYMASTGTIGNFGGFGILDDNGKDFFLVENLADNLKKVGLEVRYIGFATDGTIVLWHIEPVYFDYGPATPHSAPTSVYTHWGIDD